MVPPWAAELKVTEKRLKPHLMTAFQATGPAAVRARTLVFPVVRHLLLDYDGLDGCQEMLGFPEAQPDILQPRLFAFQTGDLLHVLTRFGFGDEVDEESHPPMVSQKSQSRSPRAYCWSRRLMARRSGRSSR